jgi:membrane glycosyltransferase
MGTVTETTATDRHGDEKEARRYVRRLGNFYRLCLVAALVVTLTGVINYLTSPHRLWFLWVAFGFAVALAFNALDTFGRRLWLNRDWEDRKIREYLDRSRR